MASELKALVKATGCKLEAEEDRQEYLARLVKAVLDLPEDDWAKLPDSDQDWVNEGVLAIKAKKPIADPDVEDEDEAPPKKKAKAKPVEDEDEDEEEAPPKKKAKAKPAAEDEDEDEDEDEAPPKKKAKPAGTGIVAALREAYITAYLKDPEVATSKVLATLEKKGIVPGKGTINVQLATVKATLKSLKERGVLGD